VQRASGQITPTDPSGEPEITPASPTKSTNPPGAISHELSGLVADHRPSDWADIGLLDRLRHGRSSTSAEQLTEAPSATAVTARLFGGDDDLEVVGEASYQSALWSICGGVQGDQIRHPIVALLVPEPQNPYDPNAIAIQIDGHVVGYLSRDVAQQYGPGLQSLMARSDGYVALRGVIVGGGYYPDGPGRLGVWLDHRIVPGWHSVTHRTGPTTTTFGSRTAPISGGRRVDCVVESATCRCRVAARRIYSPAGRRMLRDAVLNVLAARVRKQQAARTGRTPLGR
jgi:HIRAN domain